ncbi:MAG: hypothetical protein K2K74_05320 [Lachnospiraceae bacterium]|nr:hypothetical protein [Lachnospiraceae bacterium]
MEIVDNIQWHPAFCSAVELELCENKKDLKYDREHNLSRMPLRIDFLVIKKKTNAVIKNEIGDFFLKNNVFEYKSPGDSMDAGTFYKALSYACLYKDETENADEILDMDTTITLVREQKPEKLLRQLAEKYELTKRAEGIYRIHGMLFPVQFLVTGEMDEEGHVFLTSLTRTLSWEQAQRLLDKTAKLKNKEDRKNADSVINVASEANMNLFKKMIQEGDQMCEELKEMLAPEIVEFKILVAKQNKQLADKDAKLADNAAKLADKDAKLADKDAKLADKDAEIEKLKKMLAEAGIRA